MFGGLTPRNIWDMTLGEFHVLSVAVDARMRELSGREG